MVTISNGQETFLVGCNDENSNIVQIYNLVWQEDYLKWVKFHTLKYPKTRFVAMIIPDDALTYCKKCNGATTTSMSTSTSTIATTTESKSRNIFNHQISSIVVTAATILLSF